jgi:uncharacterized membrane protein (UPF0127 family)
MSAEQRTGWTRHIGTFLIIFAFAGLLMYQSRGCNSQQAQPAQRENARFVDVKIERWEIKAEVADTRDMRIQGLSNRPTLEPGRGMLFVFEEAVMAQFWMKDTTIPLSIAFLREDGTISQIERMQPNSVVKILSREPVKYALEVRQGWFEDRGIKPGVLVEMPAEIPPQSYEPEPTRSTDGGQG